MGSVGRMKNSKSELLCDGFLCENYFRITRMFYGRLSKTKCCSEKCKDIREGSYVAKVGAPAKFLDSAVFLKVAKR